jgi:aquaporin Z
MKKYVAEFIGTFALVFSGTGAIVINDLYGGVVTHIGVAITFGLIVTAMIYAFGEISGAHINPAVTVAFGLNGKLNKKEILPYILSQLGGAFLASGVLKLLFPASLNLGASLPAGSEYQSFTLEFILTYILMMVILRVSGNKETSKFTAIAVGITVLLEALFAGPICGASMNPARSIAPALVSGNLYALWLYILAPMAGAILAVLSNRIFENKLDVQTQS